MNKQHEQDQAGEDERRRFLLAKEETPWVIGRGIAMGSGCRAGLEKGYPTSEPVVSVAAEAQLRLGGATPGWAMSGDGRPLAPNRSTHRHQPRATAAHQQPSAGDLSTGRSPPIALHS